MPRTRRLKIVGDEAYYHIISKTVGGEYYLKDTEKEYLSLVRGCSSLYFVKAIGFCIMSNHFHLLVKTINNSEISNDDVTARIGDFYKIKAEEITADQWQRYRQKLTDISEYVKEIKVQFSRWYNKIND